MRAQRASAQANSVSSGLTSAHRSPSSAEMYAMPTHQMAQTMTGAMFFSGLCTPKRPAATHDQEKRDGKRAAGEQEPRSNEQSPAGGARQIRGASARPMPARCA